MENNVLDLIKRSAAIPSVPQVATRFLEIIQDPEFEIRDVVEVLSTDAGTASEILRLANSSLFGVTRKVTALPHAVTLLGIKRVRSLVLGRYIVDSINQKGCGHLDASYYWRRSLATAVLSARLADVLEPGSREEAFISGLLADVGVVILDEAMSEKYEPVISQYRPEGDPHLIAAEQDLVGTCHPEVSAAVLEYWQLPENICEAVRWHSWDLQCDTRPTLASIVGGAEQLAMLLCEKPEEMEQIVACCQQVADTLQVDLPVMARCFEGVEQQIRELSELLKIEIIASQVYAMIADELQHAVAQPAPASS
jgi:HD-like signal output (HDOD) protein